MTNLDYLLPDRETKPASLVFDLEVTQLQHYEHKQMGKLVRISSNYRQLSNIPQLYSQVTSPRVTPVFMFSSWPQTFLSQAWKDLLADTQEKGIFNKTSFKDWMIYKGNLKITYLGFYYYFSSDPSLCS